MFWEGWFFGPKLFRSFLSKERITAQKYFKKKMGNFGQCALRHQSKWFQNIAILGLAFLVIEGFDRFETVASLDAYQITNYQFYKNSSFFVAWSPKNLRNRFLNQEFYGQLPEKAWSNGLFDFFKIVPFGAPGFSKDSKVEESVY